MPPVRRVRIERLMLVTPDGATEELATARRRGGALESQDEVAVSPDGKYLAWTTAEDDRLHLRDANGHERILPRYASGRRMRFSPDGKWLAAITEVGRGDWHKLVAWELDTGRTTPLVDGEAIERFEWRADGIVVQVNDELIDVSLAGARRTLFKGAGIQRFVAAGEHREIVFVDSAHGPKILAIDLEHPERVRRLGAVRGKRVEMAETAPDGSRVVFATNTGLYFVEGDRAPRELSSRRDVHSLWFAPDGRLAYASTAGATVLDGKRTRRTQTWTSMLRFDKLSGKVMLASDHGELLGWDPATNRKTVLAKTPEGEPLLGADRYQGGVVLWTGRDDIGGSSQPHRIVRILAIAKNGVARELERVESDRAVDLGAYAAFFTTSTDGRSAAHMGLTGDQFHIRRADGTDRAVAGWGMLSPTGRDVVVARSDDAKTTGFTLVDTSTGAERDLVRGGQSEWMADGFSPDGAWLAMTHTLASHRQALVVFETATGKERTLLESDSISMSVPWTARGALLVQRTEGLAIASPQGEIKSILDEDIGPGLADVETDANRVLVCSRRDGKLRSIDLDAPSHIVDLDVPNCWTRNKALSPDGEDVVYSDGRSEGATEPLLVTSSKGGAPHSLGEGYPAVVFGWRGSLAFESHHGVQVFDGTHDAVFETDGPVAALRFTNDALTFAVGNELVAWNWTTGAKTVLAHVPDGQRILSAAALGDGFLVVTAE